MVTDSRKRRKRRKIKGLQEKAALASAGAEDPGEEEDMEHTITPEQAAELLGTTVQTIRVNMANGNLPIGFVFKNKKRNQYIITKEKFREVTGIDVKE